MNSNLLSRINTAMADYLVRPAPHPPTMPSGKASRSAAAVTIQSAARGLLVRNDIRKLQAMDAEVSAIERIIRRSIDLILADDGERLKINEMLMAVLLRMDSVRGARGYRKKLIRRAICLQELLDSIAAGEGASGEGEKGVEETMESMVEENERLRGLVEGLMDQSAVLSRRVGDLERKLRRLGRKRIRRGAVLVNWKVGGGTEGGLMRSMVEKSPVCTYGRWG